MDTSSNYKHTLHAALPGGGGVFRGAEPPRAAGRDRATGEGKVQLASPVRRRPPPRFGSSAVLGLQICTTVHMEPTI